MRGCSGTHYAGQPLPRGHVHDLHGDFLAAAALCLPCAGAQVWAGDDVGVVHQVTVLWGLLQTQFHQLPASTRELGAGGIYPTSFAKREAGPSPTGFTRLRCPGLGKIKVVLRQSQSQGVPTAPTHLCEDI